jgi:hypothetical protein
MLLAVVNCGVPAAERPAAAGRKAEEIDNLTLTGAKCPRGCRFRLRKLIIQASFSIFHHFGMSELHDFDRMFRLDGKVALVTGGQCINTLEDAEV